ncbi:MAG: helix-turn-helix domain-containing protein [Bacteroidales bacterium]
MQKITFDQLPQAVEELNEKLTNIEKLLLSNSNQNQKEEDELLTVQQAAHLLCLSVPTIYGLVQRSEIPVCKRSKRLYFSKQELYNWIKSARRKTNSEISVDADNYLKHQSK